MQNEPEVEIVLINKVLQQLNERQHKTELCLFGNGKIDGSVVWVLQELAKDLKIVTNDLKGITTDIENLNKQMINLQILMKSRPCVLDKNNCTEKKSWKDIFKNVALNYPYVIFFSCH